MSEFRFFNEIIEVINGNISSDGFCKKFEAVLEANPDMKAEWDRKLDKDPHSSILKNMLINSGIEIVEV